MIWAIGFVTTFLFGGLTGVIRASPALDFHVHDSYFIVAHFHYTVFGTVVFAMFAGFYFWWPKLTGRMLDERLGKIHFWMLFVGFHLTFLIQHLLGMQGMPRRYADYMVEDGFARARAPRHRRQNVGLRGLARVGDDLPAAAAQLRVDPADPLGAAGVGRAAAPRRRGEEGSAHPFASGPGGPRPAPGPVGLHPSEGAEDQGQAGDDGEAEDEGPHERGVRPSRGARVVVRGQSAWRTSSASTIR